MNCAMHLHYHIVDECEVTMDIMHSGADSRSHCPSYRLVVTVEFGEPVLPSKIVQRNILAIVRWLRSAVELA